MDPQFAPKTTTMRVAPAGLVEAMAIAKATLGAAVALFVRNGRAVARQFVQRASTMLVVLADRATSIGFASPASEHTVASVRVKEGARGLRRSQWDVRTGADTAQQ